MAVGLLLVLVLLRLGGPQRSADAAFLVMKKLASSRTRDNIGAMQPQQQWDAERGEWVGRRALADEEALEVPKPLYIFG